MAPRDRDCYAFGGVRRAIFKVEAAAVFATRAATASKGQSKASANDFVQRHTGAQSQRSLAGRLGIMQRGAGNQAVLRRMALTSPAQQSAAPPVLQRASVISAPGDPYEREADVIADQVMRMADPQAIAAAPPRLQRKCAACEDEEKAAIQTKAADSGDAPAEHDIAAAIGVAGRGGTSLPDALRSWFEPRFGYDFGAVRIHADAAGAAAARSVRARAYTTGRDIVFGSGQYAPGTPHGRHLLAHELVHVVQQRGGSPASPVQAVSAAPMLARQPAPPDAQAPAVPAPAPAPAAPPAAAPAAPAPAPGATPGACGIDCMDTTFQALGAAEKEARFNTQCPQGYPTGTTFFGQPIPAASSAKLRALLLQAQSLAMKAMCLDGFDPSAYTLDRAITTYATHSPGMAQAVDIDVQGQPYIMHEASRDPDKEAGERAIDKETGPVFDRIAYWSLFRKSILPKGITSVSKAPHTGNTERTWTDPATGVKNTPTTTGELYDKLAAESTGMQGYFNLLLKTDQELSSEIFAFNAVNTDGSVDLAKLQIPTDQSDASVKAFRQRIADDYRLVGGSKAQLEAFAGKPIADASHAPPDHPGDRPFQGGAPAPAAGQSGAPSAAQNRRPELGFISLPKEVVVALTQVGLVWGAIDFGGGSGDVMHFDCRLVPGC